MKKSFYIAFLLVLTSAVWFGCKEKEVPGSIYGVITDQATGEPIKTAGVELQPVGLKMVTGSEGQYEFTETDPGIYKLYVTKTNYKDFLSSEIIVKSGKNTPSNIQLEKLPPSLRIVNDNKEDIDELDFGSNKDDVTRSFNIFNDGEQSLQWELTKTADWITEVSRKNGELQAGATQGIILTIDRDLLTTVENVTTIHITSNNGNKELKVKVTGELLKLPVLNTLEATDVRMTSAIFHGELTESGSPTYNERGFVYALSSMPTIENTINKLTVAVTANKSYQATATGLEEGKTYYVRAYAINKAGTAYSTNETNFTASKVLPDLRTEDISNMNFNEKCATLNGTINDEGEPAYTERGFVYATTHNPMLDDAAKVMVFGSGRGVYSTKVTDLRVGEIYYVRAYAINEAGVAYGNEMSFCLEYPNSIVLKECGLMVQKKDLGSLDWESAYNACKSSTLDGFLDWRLPTVGELSELYSRKNSIGGFYDATSDGSFYWSSTHHSGDGYNEWIYYYGMYFQSGNMDGRDARYSSKVRAVRTITE